MPCCGGTRGIVPASDFCVEFIDWPRVHALLEQAPRSYVCFGSADTKHIAIIGCLKRSHPSRTSHSSYFTARHGRLTHRPTDFTLNQQYTSPRCKARKVKRQVRRLTCDASHAGGAPSCSPAASAARSSAAPLLRLLARRRLPRRRLCRKSMYSGTDNRSGTRITFWGWPPQGTRAGGGSSPPASRRAPSWRGVHVPPPRSDRPDL